MESKSSDQAASLEKASPAHNELNAFTSGSPARSVSTEFAEAVRNYKSGRLAEAASLCRQILSTNDRHPDSLHLLGVIAARAGRREEAIDLIGQAIRLHDDTNIYHINLGRILRHQGKLDDAAPHFARALTLKPDFAEVHHELADILKSLGKSSDAMKHYEATLALRPTHANAHNSLAILLGEQGQVAEAITHYEQALAIDPDFAEAHNNFGIVLNQQGRSTQAITHYKRALATRPDYAEAHNNLAITLRGEGRLGEAETHYRRALNLKPNFAEAYNNLGILLNDQGKRNDAAISYQHAISIRPDYAEAHNNLGIVLSDQGKHLDAIAHYERALLVRPDFAEAHNNLGIALQHLSRLNDAKTHYERALAINPTFAEAHNNLGNICRSLGEVDSAMASYQRAVAFRPGYTDAYINLGILFRERGDLIRAASSFVKANELSPRNGVVYRELVANKRVTRGDRHLEAMETLAREMASLPVGDQKELHFALGKAYADLELHAMSFRHFLAGNALRRSEFVYDETTSLAFFDRIRNVFTADLMRRGRESGDPSTTPIFIVGMPRSGTTLAEQILASHPHIFGAGELEIFFRASTDLCSKNEKSSVFPESVPALTAAELRHLGGIYAEATRAMAPKARRIVDKMPQNFFYLGLIHLALPGARIIHMRRDPIDTCLSCFRQTFETGHPYCYELSELGRYYRAYLGLMSHWRRTLPERVLLEVNYEDLVANVEEQARGMLAHCGLEWDDACLAFHETRRIVRTASAVQVRQPLYRTSVGNWRPYEAFLQPLMEGLGLPDHFSQ